MVEQQPVELKVAQRIVLAQCRTQTRNVVAPETVEGLLKLVVAANLVRTNPWVRWAGDWRFRWPHGTDKEQR